MKYKYTHFSLLKTYHYVLVKYKNTHFSLLKIYHNILVKYKNTHFWLLKTYHNVLVKYKNTHFSLLKTYHNVLVKYKATLWLHSDVLLNNCSSIYINDGYLTIWWVFRILRLLDCFCNVLVYISHMRVQQSFPPLHC